MTTGVEWSPMEELSTPQEDALRQAAFEIAKEDLRSLFNQADDSITATNALDYWLQQRLEMTYKEIGEMRGANARAVRASQKRAREALYE